MQLSAVFFNFPGTAAAYTGEWYGDVNANDIVDADAAGCICANHTIGASRSIL